MRCAKLTDDNDLVVEIHVEASKEFIVCEVQNIVQGLLYQLDCFIVNRLMPLFCCTAMNGYPRNARVLCFATKIHSLPGKQKTRNTSLRDSLSRESPFNQCIKNHLEKVLNHDHLVAHIPRVLRHPKNRCRLAAYSLACYTSRGLDWAATGLGKL